MAVLASSVLVVELISRGEGSPSTFHNRLKLRWTMLDQRKSDPKSSPLLHACHPLVLLAHSSKHRDMIVNSEKLLVWSLANNPPRLKFTEAWNKAWGLRNGEAWKCARLQISSLVNGELKNSIICLKNGQPRAGPGCFGGITDIRHCPLALLLLLLLLLLSCAVFHYIMLLHNRYALLIFNEMRWDTFSSQLPIIFWTIQKVKNRVRRRQANGWRGRHISSEQRRSLLLLTLGSG